MIDESKIPPAKAPSKPEDKKPSMQYELCDALGIGDWDAENITALRKTYLAQCARIDELTRNDFSSLVNKAVKLLKIDTNGFYNKK